MSDEFKKYFLKRQETQTKFRASNQAAQPPGKPHDHKDSLFKNEWTRKRNDSRIPAQSARLLHHVSDNAACGSVDKTHLSNCSGRAFVHRTVCSQILYQHLLLQRNQSHLVNGLFHTVKRWPCCLCSNLLIPLIKASSKALPMPFVGSRTGVGRLADRSARRHSLGTLTTLVSVSSGVKVRV